MGEHPASDDDLRAERTCVVATAGHVDHGKSTLVRVLTGTDPDRLDEERRRGLTIDLGFAELPLPSGTVAFVDVPGHIRFIRNMLAGVGAIDAALLVVDAREGWKPQSEEHLRILDLVGVTRGVVALTKVDGLDDDDVELARLVIADATAGTAFARAPVVTVDALAGRGLDALRGELDQLVATSVAPATGGRARLWVDRAFVVAGAGTVVTGTLSGGELQVDDQVEVHGRSPGRLARIRRLQSFGRDRERVPPGSRVAVNLAGVDRVEVARGSTVLTPGRWHRTDRFDADVRVLATSAGLSRRAALALHIGTVEVPVRLRILGADEIPPGGAGLVRIAAAAAVPLTPGDRFVLRDLGRSCTVGGGEVLDVDPVLRARAARPDRSVDRVVAERGWVPADELERLTGERRPPTVGHWVVDPAQRARRTAQLAELVSDAGPLGLDIATLDERDRALLPSVADVVIAEGRARTAATAAADDLHRHPYLAALEAAPFRPPDPAAVGVPPAELQALVRRGLVVREGDVYFAATALDEAARVVASLLGRHPEGITVSIAREALDTTRKWVLPLLTALDARGVTLRRGDVRLAGRRCPVV